MAQEFIEDRRQAKCSEDYLRDLRYRLDRFTGAFQTNLADVTRSDLLRFLNNLGLSPYSLYNFRKVLSIFFKFAKSRGYLPKEHADVEGLEVGDNDPGEIEIFTPAEMTSLLSVAQPELVPFLAMGGFAGLRSKELGRLDWSEVQLSRGFIELKRSKTKTARRRLVPIQPNLAQWLAPYAKQSGPVWVYGAANLSKRKREAAKDAGVKWKHNALRHSFASSDGRRRMASPMRCPTGIADGTVWMGDPL